MYCSSPNSEERYESLFTRVGSGADGLNKNSTSVRTSLFLEASNIIHAAGAMSDNSIISFIEFSRIMNFVFETLHSHNLTRIFHFLTYVLSFRSSRKSIKAFCLYRALPLRHIALSSLKTAFS